jgi:SHS2 domain-containing protein
MTKPKHSLIPSGESLRQAVRWMSENAPATVDKINTAACRFDLTPVEEEFLLREFLPQVTWEHFHHQADIGVRGIGHTLAQSFEQAGLALTAVVTDIARVQALQRVGIACAEQDPELLFVDWLNAIIYQMATTNMLFSRFQVTIAEGKLTAILTGEPVDRTRHEPAVEPKGATFTELKVVRRSDGSWIAQCVIDV